MPTFTRTQFANLVRSEATGFYFVRAHVHGRLIRRKLHTKSLTIAKVKLDELLAVERAKIPQSDEETTFGHLAADWLQTVDEDHTLKPRSKHYRKETLELIYRTWPKLAGLHPRKVTPEALADWGKRMRETGGRSGKGYSASRYNGAVETMRAILGLAADRGLASENAALKVARKPLTIEPPTLPEPEQFIKLLERLDALPERKEAALAIRFLAYTGCRVGVLPLLTAESLDLESNQVILPPWKYQEEPTYVPMIPQMRELAGQLLANRKGKLFKIKDPSRALAKSCQEAGIAHLTPHDMRHLFATRCLEAKIDVPTVARWVAHRDGGALLMKRYAHLRDTHSQKMAKKVKF